VSQKNFDTLDMRFCVGFDRFFPQNIFTLHANFLTAQTCSTRAPSHLFDIIIIVIARATGYRFLANKVMAKRRGKTAEL